MGVHTLSPGGTRVIIVAAISLTIATAMIILRFVARIRSRSLGIDDWASLTGFVSLVGFVICLILFSDYKNCRAHAGAAFTPEQTRHFLIMIYANNFLYTFASAAVKMSILLLYRRIFTTRPFQIVTNLIAGGLILWCICLVFLQIFFCRPIWAWWEPENTGYCLDKDMFYQAVAITNVIWDFILLFLPLPMIWNLNMTKKRKLQLCGIFFVGSFMCVCSIFRTFVLYHYKERNLTEQFWHIAIWTDLELAIGVCCACIPPLANLFREWHQKATRIYQRRLSSNDTMPQPVRSVSSRPLGSKATKPTPEMKDEIYV